MHQDYPQDLIYWQIVNGIQNQCTQYNKNKKIFVQSVSLNNNAHSGNKIQIQQMDIDPQVLGLNNLTTRNIDKKNRQMNRSITLDLVNSIRQGTDQKLYSFLDRNINQSLVLELFSNSDDQQIERNLKTPEKTKMIFCNCKKTQCQKRYCECVKAGQSCNDECLCLNCNNKFQIKKEQKSQIIDDYNSSPDPERHTSKKEGCSCKRSECKKKYCECFQMKIKCNESCKCFPCKNKEESLIRQTNTKLFNPLIFTSKQVKIEENNNISSYPFQANTLNDNIGKTSVNLQQFPNCLIQSIFEK